MRFEDALHGVTFQYPSRWSFSEQSSFYSPLAIASSDAPLRSDVFVKEFPGIARWPVTDLDGAEFGYGERDNLSPEDCRRLASLASGAGSARDQQTIGGVVFSHGRGENAGMSHDVKEDVYTTSSGKGCLLFDLAVHHVVAPSATRTPRALTAQELAKVNGSLQEILHSVRIERAQPTN